MKQCNQCWAVKDEDDFVPREKKRGKWICKACAACKEKEEAHEGII